MRSNKNQSKNLPAPIYRAIPEPAVPQEERPDAAATMRELNRYAEDVQAFLRASRMRTILNRLHRDIDRTSVPEVPAVGYMRLRRD